MRGWCGTAPCNDAQRAMTAFLGFLAAAIAFAGTLLDYFLPERRKDAFFARLARLGEQLHRTSAGDLVGSEAEAVLRVLERLFGPRTFSRRRFATVLVAYAGTIALAYVVIEYGRFLADLPWRPPFDDFHFWTGFPTQYVAIFAATDVSLRVGRLLARMPRLPAVALLAFPTLHAALFLFSLAISDVFSAALAELVFSIPVVLLAHAVQEITGLNFDGWVEKIDSYNRFGISISTALQTLYNNILISAISLKDTLLFELFGYGEDLIYNDVPSLLDIVIIRVSWPIWLINSYPDFAIRMGALWKPTMLTSEEAFVPTAIYENLVLWFMPFFRMSFAVGFAYAWAVARLGSRLFAHALRDLAARRGPVFSLLFGAVSLFVAALAWLAEQGGDSPAQRWIALPLPM